MKQNRFYRGIRFFSLLLCMLMLFPSSILAESEKQDTQLRFNADGKFKIMMVSDFQDYINDEKKNVNPKSIDLLNKAIEQENPDLLVITGDMIGGDMNGEQLQEYIRQMVAPMEEHQLPWLITYGNHDEDAKAALDEGWNKIKQLDYYRSFAYNLNVPSMSGEEKLDANGVNTSAVGDMYVLIYDHEGQKPLYNVWALDSNRYDTTGLGSYDWIHPGQIVWYYQTSKDLEKQYGKLNSLMFFHIPLPEWQIMRENALRYNVSGHNFEKESPGALNSGLFAAALDRGDVRGIFVGHDHVSDYEGEFLGIHLGYDANVGFETYGLGGEENDAMRGVRIFTLDAQDLGKLETHMLYASDLGVN